MTNLRKAASTDIKGIATVVYDVWAQDILTDICEAQIKDGCVSEIVSLRGQGQ